jgi:chorismate mutase
MIKAIRGAATVRSNTAADIEGATQQMLKEIVAANKLTSGQIISALFTLTPDLNAAFPATAARADDWTDDPWTDVPMMCAQEIPVPGALAMVVRVMLHAEVTGPVQHVYRGGAVALRRDLAREP